MQLEAITLGLTDTASVTVTCDGDTIELTQRDETITAMQNQLREFTDWLELRPSF